MNTSEYWKRMFDEIPKDVEETWMDAITEVKGWMKFGFIIMSFIVVGIFYTYTWLISLITFPFWHLIKKCKGARQ